MPFEYDQSNIQVWAKDLEDGNKAIGVFNLGDNSEEYTLDLRLIGIENNIKLRDLWRQKEFKKTGGKNTFKIPSYGVYLLKTDSL